MAASGINVNVNVESFPTERVGEVADSITADAASTLHALSNVPADLRKRYELIVSTFQRTFGPDRRIDFIVRAPGRINLVLKQLSDKQSQGYGIMR
jgi:hypothetical protein